MLRPTIAFAAAGAVGGDPTQMLDAARVVELLHCASLVHDDLVDESAQLARWPLPAALCRSRRG